MKKRVKDEYYSLVVEYCRRMNIDIPSRNDNTYIIEILERMKKVGLI